MPTVADRIAQTVVAIRLEEQVEPIFHPDSYGYRPNRSALDAVGGLSATLLELRLGHRSGRGEVLRQCALGSGHQSSGRTHRPIMGAAVCEAVACRTTAAARWHPAPARSWHPARVGGFPRCWRTCFCTTRSICGCVGNFRRSRSSGMPMTRSCTAPVSGKLTRCRRRSQPGWNLSGCACIRTRPGSCTARTPTGAALLSTRRLRFWVTCFALAGARNRNGVVFTSFLPAVSPPDALKKMGAGAAPMEVAPSHRSVLR